MKGLENSKSQNLINPKYDFMKISFLSTDKTVCGSPYKKSISCKTDDVDMKYKKIMFPLRVYKHLNLQRNSFFIFLNF